MNIEKLLKPVSVTFPLGHWDVIIGLLTGERSRIALDPDRKEYLATLDDMRRRITECQERTWGWR